MKTLSLFLLLLSHINCAQAQSEKDLIKTAIQKYIDGTSLNNPELISEAFYDDAYLFLSKEGEEIWLVPVEDYAGFFNKGDKGKPNGRTGKILSIDQQNDIAIAKAEILIPSNDLKFIDLFLLKKLSGEWKIISKAATRIE
ncbi:MAG: nuclear transport factor 2 family protein [Rhodothermales bacterium]